MRSSAVTDSAPRIPLVVVGALRAGGSGKTSVTLELARELARTGLRPAILCYRLGPGRPGTHPAAPGPDGSPPAGDPMEVGAEDEWAWSSEEAVMLRRDSGMRVFATRDRARAWRRLHHPDFQADGAFDILISDDGFQDPRLDGALRILLSAPGERPGLFDLLPGGPFRETASASRRADLRLEGPYPSGDGKEVTAELPRYPSGAVPAAFPFRRRLILPPGIDGGRPWIAFCALGDNRPFLRDLEREGVRPVAVILGRNHAAPPLEKLQSAAARHPGAGILCTRKDFLKLEAAGPEAARLPLYQVDQAVSLPPEFPAAVMSRLLPSGNAYLVHYPG
ncbi:MAG: putative tetraacyldisaccharide 4-kinase [Fibrobacteres bacterium]|nr:putative tetraacyldisaccharide 4-kinase [Fibrobacterota bacterium]